jgi:prepilin peptidase CpaA
MALELQIVALAGFAGLMLAAAFEDLRRLIIPNALIVALCVIWPLHLAAAPSLYGALGALGCALAVFLAGAVCFSHGWLGGGDVKLLAVATLWAGPEATPALLLLTGILGGVLALILMMPPGAYIATLARAKLGPSDNSASGGHGLATPIPYGIAIAGAAVIVILLPHFH